MNFATVGGVGADSSKNLLEWDKVRFVGASTGFKRREFLIFDYAGACQKSSFIDRTGHKSETTIEKLTG